MIQYSTPPVVTKLMGGLGNQMFQLAAAIGVASRFGGSVAIDTSFYRQTGDWTPRPFSLHQAFAHTRQFLEVGPEVWQSMPHVTQGNAPYIEEFSKIASPVYLDGYWQSEHCFNHCKDVIRSLFLFHSIPESCLPYAQHMLSTESVSLHIRRGDYVHTEAGNRIHNVCGTEYYANALQILLTQVNAPTLFVFCDEPDWVRANFQADIPWNLIDTGLPHEPWHDMHLMALCKHHIVANSSFSWWGAWLGQYPGMVLAPDRWVNSPEGIHNIIPENWSAVGGADQQDVSFVPVTTQLNSETLKRNTMLTKGFYSWCPAAQEDVILFRLLADIKEGVYVDVGAHHPENQSVTKAFYDRLWFGINVEPLPNMFALLCKERPRDINVNVCVSNTASDCKFYVCVTPECDTLSTLNQETALRLAADHGFVFEETTIPSCTLSSIFDEYVKNQTVHFLKIDVETHEKQVIESLDFSKYQPWVLCVESTIPYGEGSLHSEWESLLVDHGYIFAIEHSYNRYYIHKDKFNERVRAFETNQFLIVTR